MRGCADPRRPHGWIDEEFIVAYTELHRLGWAHSIEVWRDGASGGRAVRPRAGWALRRRVEVPPRTRCVEGGGRRARRADARATVGRCSTCSGPRRTCGRSAPSTSLATSTSAGWPTHWPARCRCRSAATASSVGGMDAMVVYHNPVCSKSRGALEILGDKGADVEVIEYLKAKPSRADLERIVDAIPDPPAALVRKDKRFAELGLDAERLSVQGRRRGAAARAPRAHGAPGGVPRRSCAHLSSERESARTARLISRARATRGRARAPARSRPARPRASPRLRCRVAGATRATSGTTSSRRRGSPSPRARATSARSSSR